MSIIAHFTERNNLQVSQKKRKNSEKPRFTKFKKVLDKYN